MEPRSRQLLQSHPVAHAIHRRRPPQNPTSRTPNPHIDTTSQLTEDSSNCGQPDGDWARCWFFPARDDVEGEVDTCGPDEAGGVPDRDTYDSLVASMRNGERQGHTRQDRYGEGGL